MQDLKDAIQRLNEALDIAEARQRMKAAIAIALGMLEQLPGFPPIPGCSDWNKTQAECDEQIDTLTYNQCMMWGYSAAVYVE